MATYRNEFTVISRSTGRSVVACAAYRSGEHLPDDRYEKTYDYTNRAGVLHSEIILSSDAPDRLSDRSRLWNEVEAIEKRKDAQLARECLVALPHELTDDQRRELVRGYVQSQFVDKGMIADVAIHAPGREGDERNHHAHIMLTMRDVTADGFGKKNRDWNQKPFLESARKEWAGHVNQALQRAGTVERVDHRSVAAQRSEAQQNAQSAEARGDQKAAQQAEFASQRLNYVPERQLSRTQYQLARRVIALGQEIRIEHTRQHWQQKIAARSLRQQALAISLELRDKVGGFISEVKEKSKLTGVFGTKSKLSRKNVQKATDQKTLRAEAIREYNQEVATKKSERDKAQQPTKEQKPRVTEPRKQGFSY